jgi:glycosyltransferase involved in cell wall biosynthesis
MRVAIVMSLAERRGGSETVLRQLMREGRDQGIEWSVIFLEDGPMVQEFEDLGIPCSVVPAGRVRQAHRFIRSIIAIRSIARGQRADLILSWMTKAQLYGGVAGSLARIPSVWYQHGLPAADSWLDRLATILPARGVIATSQAAAAAQGKLRPVRRQRVVHPGIDLARFDPARLPPREEVRAALDLPTAGPLVGFFGRLQRWKGPHVLLEAMPAVLEAFPDAHCMIVGGRHELEPDYADYLRRLTTARGLDRYVLFAGFQHDVPRWMQAVDVIALPSDHEPFGVTVVEAMAMGKPVIAGNSAGPTETITSGVDGILVGHDDPAAIAAAIVRCLQQPDVAGRLGAAARMRAQHFSAKRHARELVRALQKLTRG